MKKLIRKWDFWYWLAVAMILLGGLLYIQFVEGDGLGAGILLVLLGMLALYLCVMYVIAKLGQLLVIWIVARNKKPN